jgi:hypothetical protein
MLHFDKEAGWYVYTPSSVGGFGNKATYEDSGGINSMYICNVGKNGRIDNMGSDDICMMFNTYTGQGTSVFPNLGGPDYD